MQRFFTFTAIILAGCLALAGCATTSSKLNQPYVSDPKHSYAWNVANAAGLNVKDVPWEKVQKAQEEALAKGAPGTDTGPSALGAATYGVVHGMNMGNLLSGGLGALAWLSTGNTPDMEVYCHMFAWMPKEMAATAEEALSSLDAIVDDGMRKSLTETVFPVGFTVSTERQGFRAWTGKWLSPGKYPVVGGECSTDNVSCGYATGFPKLPVEGVAPNFLGGAPVWSWSVVGKNRGVGLSSSSFVRKRSKRAEARFPDLEVMTRLSSHLPEWVFIYLTPGYCQISMQDGNGGFVFLGHPLVLNQGKAYLLIEPPPQS